MLSYQAICFPRLMHADPGWTIERFSGTRAATTFRKLPTASPGTRKMAATAASTAALSTVARTKLSWQLAFLAPRWRCEAGGDSVNNTAPESIVPPAGRAVRGGRLRRPGAGGGQGRELGAVGRRWIGLRVDRRRPRHPNRNGRDQR